jgi:hypothetical protein
LVRHTSAPFAVTERGTGMADERDRWVAWANTCLPRAVGTAPGSPVGLMLISVDFGGLCRVESASSAFWRRLEDIVCWC